jgi:hypothetical protein
MMLERVKAFVERLEGYKVKRSNLSTFKLFVFIFSSLLLFLTSCNLQTRATPSAIPQVSSTLAATETPTAKPTQTLKRYPALTKTPSPTITPTFDVRTPSYARCSGIS